MNKIDDDRGPLNSYAQNFEDVMLWRALRHLATGFYIDVGAQDPVTDSVSLGFYKMGWRGVHVEPTPFYSQKLKAARPDETVIQAAISDQPGSISFYDVTQTGLSTADASIAEQHRRAGHEVIATNVPSMTLDELLDRHADREIHWLKIDVEGYERQVIDSWVKSKVRPWILVVESTNPGTEVTREQLWEKNLKSKGYKHIYFDGLNRFYLHKRHSDLEHHFSVGPNCFDNFVYTGETTNRFCQILTKHIAWLEQIYADARAHLAAQHDALIANQGLAERVGRLEAQAQESLEAHARANRAYAELADLRGRAELAELRLSQILASRSWQITAPIRALTGLARRDPPIPVPAHPAEPQASPPALPPAPSPIEPRPPVAVAPADRIRLVIDLQGAQGENRNRGIGRYSLAMTDALIRRGPSHEIIVVLNAGLADQDLLDWLSARLPRQQIRIWSAPGNVGITGDSSLREAAEELREAFIASLDPDVVYLTSLFEGLAADGVTSIKRFAPQIPTAVTLYDLIPLLNPEIYLDPHPQMRDWYYRKLDELRRADMCIAISHASRQEAIDHLGFDAEQVVVASAAVDGNFSPRHYSAAEELALQTTANW